MKLYASSGTARLLVEAEEPVEAAMELVDRLGWRDELNRLGWSVWIAERGFDSPQGWHYLTAEIMTDLGVDMADWKPHPSSVKGTNPNG